MDKKGPGSIRDLGSFEGLHPPCIDLTLMSRRGAVHCLHKHSAPRSVTANVSEMTRPYLSIQIAGMQWKVMLGIREPRVRVWQVLHDESCSGGD
jgi:hypothetical protein